MREEWRTIRGYEGYYKVSSLGRVHSLFSGIIMKSRKHYKDSVLIVGLTKDNHQKLYQVHKLVAEAFHRKKEGEKWVHAKDGNLMNVTKDNLYWSTHKNPRTTDKLNKKNERTWLVAQVRYLYSKGKTITQLSKQFGFGSTTVSAWVHRVNLAHVEPATREMTYEEYKKENNITG